jgi:hypothetical protein
VIYHYWQKLFLVLFFGQIFFNSILDINSAAIGVTASTIAELSM